MAKWPEDNEAALIKFYGTPKTSALESQLVDVIPPFKMYYAGKQISRIGFHKKAAPALRAALQEIWDNYGHDQAAIDKARVSVYSGAYNPRKISGSNKWSNHAFAAAIDIDAEHNGFGAGKGTIPKIVIDAFKRQGARWGGEYKGRTDPMHFEFAGGGDMMLPGDTPVVAEDLTSKTKKMGELMISYEFTGPLKVETVSDGTKEVAGVNQKFHAAKFEELRKLVAAGDQAGARKAAAEYAVDITNVVANWHTEPRVIFNLRDCGYNRGTTGAARILQFAVGADPDGVVGPATKKLVNAKTADDLIVAIRGGREKYERCLNYAGVYLGPGPKRGESWDKWRGMVNRWNKVQADCQQFKSNTPMVAAVAGTAAVAGGGVAMATMVPEFSWSAALPVTIIVIGIAAIIVAILRRNK